MLHHVLMLQLKLLSTWQLFGQTSSRWQHYHCEPCCRPQKSSKSARLGTFYSANNKPEGLKLARTGHACTRPKDGCHAVPGNGIPHPPWRNASRLLFMFGRGSHCLAWHDDHLEAKILCNFHEPVVSPISVLLMSVIRLTML